MSDKDNPFEPNDYTPERTLARITELQPYLRDELLPEAVARTDSIFVADFIRYFGVCHTESSRIQFAAANCV